MKCIHCGGKTRMQVQAVISAPGELANQLSKKNLRSKEVYLMGVLWETADYICAEPNCGRLVLDGYGNYVTNLKKRVKELEASLADTLDFVEHHSNRWDGVNGKHPSEVVESARKLLEK
jgi:hypothetical protein